MECFGTEHLSSLQSCNPLPFTSRDNAGFWEQGSWGQEGSEVAKALQEAGMRAGELGNGLGAPGLSRGGAGGEQGVSRDAQG